MALPTKTILCAIVDQFGIPHAELVGESRKSHVIEARYAAAWALRRAGYASTLVGRLLNRDHSTILYAARRAMELAQQHADYCEKLRKIEQLLDLPSILPESTPPRQRSKYYTERLRLALAFWGLKKVISA